MRAYVIYPALFLLAGCARDALDPFALAPSTPYSTWTECGSKLVSSKFCKTILPPDFGSNELSLAELLDIALQNNPSTKQTWARARASAAQYGQSLSPFYPNVQFSSFYFREKAAFPTSGVPTDTPGTPTTISAGSGSIQESYFTEAGPDVILSYTLFDFGQRTAASAAAREALYYADLNHNQQIQNVLQNTMSDYYEYLYRMSAVKSGEENLKSAKEALDAANERFAMGVVALGDVAQARTQYLQTKIDFTRQKQASEDAFTQLAVDLGLAASEKFPVQGMPEETNAHPILEDLDNLVAQAQEQRQDFLAAQADVRSKQAALLQAKRAYLPTLTSQLATGRYWYQDHLSEHENHWSAQVSLSFPIFTGFSLRNQVRQAEAGVELSKAALLQRELSIIQDVTVARTTVQSAASTLNDSTEYLHAAQLQFSIALAGYKAGTMTILDLLSAQSALADARTKRIEAQKSWFVSLSSLAHATGALCASPKDEV